MSIFFVTPTLIRSGLLNMTSILLELEQPAVFWPIVCQKIRNGMYCLSKLVAMNRCSWTCRLSLIFCNHSKRQQYRTDNTSENSRYCLAMENQQCLFPRGKVMGGSSFLNYMIYTRGNPNDYDEWAKMGAIGWSYKDVDANF